MASTTIQVASQIKSIGVEIKPIKNNICRIAIINHRVIIQTWREGQQYYAVKIITHLE